MSQRGRRCVERPCDLPVFVAVAVVWLATLAMPLASFRWVAKVLGWAGRWLSSGGRRRVCRNLEIAFPGTLSAAQKQRICRAVFFHVTYTFLELMHAARVLSGDLDRLVRVDNGKVLDELLRKGDGVVGIGGHLGGFSTIQGYLARKGYVSTVIVRNTNNLYLARFLAWVGKTSGVPTISKWNMRRAVRESAEWLRRGGLVMFYLDQHAGNGISVDLFGRKVLAPAGAAVFCRRYGCPAVGLFSYREPSGRHRLVVEGPYHLPRDSGGKVDVQAATSFFYERVEFHVRQHPEQWLTWFTRRFRDH